MKSLRNCTALCAIAAALTISGCGNPGPAEKLGQARTRLASGEVDAAIVLLMDALQQQPRMAEARALLGQALLAKGDAGAATIEFRKAAAESGQPATILPWLALALLADQKYGAIVAEFGNAEIEGPAQRASLMSSVAAAHLALGDPEKAEQAVAIALAAEPQHGDALLVKARLLQRSGNLDGALALVEQVLAGAPRSVQAWLLKSEMLLGRTDKRPDATAALEQAIAIDPHGVQARLMLGATLLSAGDMAGAERQLVELRRRHPANAQTAFLGARVAYAKRDFEEAATLMAPLLEIDRSNAQLLQIMGAIELERRQFVQAEKTLGTALSLSPQSPVIRQLLARTYLEIGQPDKALGALQPLLEGGSAEAGAFALAGQAFLKTGALAKSEEALSSAISLDPTDSVSRTYLALARVGAAGADATAAALQEISKSDKGTLADLALIDLLQKNRKPEEALRAIDILAAKLPNSAIPDNLRGQVRLAAGDPTRARAAFESALQKEGHFVPAVASLAQLDLKDGKLADGRTRFEALLKAQPQDAAAEVAYARLLLLANAPKDEIVLHLRRAIQLRPTGIEARLLLANYLLGQKDARGALLAAQEASTQLPGNPDVLDMLGRAQVAAGEVNQGIASFIKLTNQVPDAPLGYVHLAGAYLRAGNVAAATSNLKRALAVRPDFLPAQEALVGLARSANRSDEALAIVKQVQRQRPNEAAGFLLEADIEASRKNYPAAIRAYQATLKRFPLPQIAIEFHAVLLRSGDAPAAGRLADEWATGRRRSVPFISYLGDLAVARQDFATAEARYREVLAIQPENAAVINNVAWAMVQQKKAGAVAMAERAVALNPDIAGFLDTLAAAQAADGQIKQALASQKKAVTLAPTHPHLQLNLAKLEVRTGDKEAARTRLDTLLKSTLPDAIRTEAMQIAKTMR